MDLRRTGNNILQIVFSLVLGGAILYWMYRGFDLNQVRNAMQYDMDWTWMLLSLPFGVTAQMFRGLRWCQTLDPIGEHARKHTAVNAIFLSYATSLVIPRVGEFLRCGVLKRYDGVAFPKALGTVVTERAVDAVVVAAITLTTILLQLSVFTDKDGHPHRHPPHSVYLYRLSGHRHLSGGRRGTCGFPAAQDGHL